MGLDRKQIIDLLKRSEAMEEEMSGILLELLDPGMLPQGMAQADRDKIMAMVAVIHKDTLSHRQTVVGLIDRLVKE